MHQFGSSAPAVGEKDGHLDISRNERVAFALEPESRKQFFTQFDPTRLPGVDCESVELSSLDAKTWERFLVDWQPTVILTGWGTPSLPTDYAGSPDVPLRYVCHLAGSVRQIVPRPLIERGVLVSNWGTTTSTAVAEHAVLLTLGALRDLPSWADYMDAWPEGGRSASHLPLETRLLRGKRVGLHGFGSIARELTGMLRAFGVELAAYSRGVPTALFERYGVACHGSLKELFANSDVVIECEALTSQTQGSVDEATLRCLPAGAVFVNVGRGAVVDEAALIRVAREKKLRLGLDVYSEEPLSPDSLLRELPSTLLSPHIAGPAKDGFADLCRFAGANLQRYLRGQPIEARISLEIYDRST